MIHARYSFPHFRRFGRELSKLLDRVCLATAREAPREQVRLVRRRRKPDGSKQKRNARSTIARKGHSVPLLDLGVLIERSHYPVRSTGRGYAVALPLGRRQVLRHLRASGYDLWRINDALREYARTQMRKGLDAIAARAAELAERGRG